MHPTLVRFGVAAGSRLLVKRLGSRGLQPPRELAQFLGAVDLDADMIDARCPCAFGDREVDLRIVKHPLCVVVFHDNRRCAEKRLVKLERLSKVGHADVQVHALHEVTS